VAARARSPSPRRDLVAGLVVCTTLACGPAQLGLEGGESSEASDDVGASSSTSTTTSTSETSTSTSGTSTSESDDATSDDATSEGEAPDACPAEPLLGDYEVTLDGHASAIEYTNIDDYIIWTHACTVISHVGTLAGGETIELACIDENAQDVAHVIELLAVVEGAPDQAPIVVGQQVELALWLRFWWGGTVAWTLRDADQNLLLLSYNGPYLPAPSETFAAPPEHVAPLTIDVNHEVCPWYCPEESTGGFIPDPGCCSRDTALRVDLGQGVVEVQGGSAAAVPGGGHVIVETATDIDLNTCSVTDIEGTRYVFAFVGD
jgi:hypothetical protein